RCISARPRRANQMNKQIISKKVFLLFVAVVVTATGTAFAEIEQPSQITIQGIGLFTKSSTDQIPSHDATKSGGVLVGYSYQFKRMFAFEENYGYTRNTQNYGTLSGQTSVETDVHEVMAGLIMRLPVKVRGVRPYVLGRSGALIFAPTDKSAAPEIQR